MNGSFYILFSRNGLVSWMGPFTRLGLEATLRFAYQPGAVISETVGIEEA